LETPRDYDALRPRFAWLPTTSSRRLARSPPSMPLNTVL
jgi:hypothetical protein